MPRLGRAIRWLRGSLLWLAVGAVASVAVAEGLALYAPLREGFASSRRAETPGEWAVSASAASKSGVVMPAVPDAEARFERLHAAALPLWESPYEAVEVARSQNLFVERARCVEFETFIMGYDATDTSAAIVYGVRAGWPLRCVCAYRFNMIKGWGRSPGVEPRWSGAVEAPRWLRARAGAWNMARPIPVAPLWGGLVVNAAVFGAAGALMATAVRAVRLRAMVRRGRCTRCGYALKGTTGPVCPECGAAKLVAA